MFELGAKVQVLRRGVFFPARANKLYELYRHYNSLDEIDEKTKKQLQEKYFMKSFREIYDDCTKFYSRGVIEKAEQNPKQKMALVFRWYFGRSTRLALEGKEENKVDFQIQCGPALGAFNQWVKGTDLEDWEKRHVDKIGLKLLHATAKLLTERFEKMNNNVAA
jgi:trans-AT polyketide synthase/acyltransferase/oxidoreductase domain-containing protein